MGQLMSMHGGQLEEGLATDTTEVNALLDVDLANVSVQPEIKNEKKKS